MLRPTRRSFVAFGTAALLTVGMVSGTVFAATPTPTPPAGAPTQDYHQVFTAKLAAALGIDQTKLTAAVKQAQLDTLDQAVQNGDLAQNQADEMRQRIQSGDPGGFGPFGGPQRGGPGGPGRGGPAMRVVDQAAADKLGMTLDELHTQLRAGKTLAELAQAKGLTVDELRAAMVAAAKKQLDQDVAAGKLTQAQADEQLQRLQQSNLTEAGRGPRR